MEWIEGRDILKVQRHVIMSTFYVVCATLQLSYSPRFIESCDLALCSERESYMRGKKNLVISHTLSPAKWVGEHVKWGEFFFFSSYSPTHVDMWTQTITPHWTEICKSLNSDLWYLLAYDTTNAARLTALLTRSRDVVCKEWYVLCFQKNVSVIYVWRYICYIWRYVSKKKIQLKCAYSCTCALGY